MTAGRKMVVACSATVFSAERSHALQPGFRCGGPSHADTGSDESSKKKYGGFGCYIGTHLEINSDDVFDSDTFFNDENHNPLRGCSSAKYQSGQAKRQPCNFFGCGSSEDALTSDTVDDYTSFLDENDNALQIDTNFDGKEMFFEDDASSDDSIGSLTLQPKAAAKDLDVDQQDAVSLEKKAVADQTDMFLKALKDVIAQTEDYDDDEDAMKKHLSLVVDLIKDKGQKYDLINTQEVCADQEKQLCEFIANHVAFGLLEGVAMAVFGQDGMSQLQFEFIAATLQVMSKWNTDKDLPKDGNVETFLDWWSRNVSALLELEQDLFTRAYAEASKINVQFFKGQDKLFERRLSRFETIGELRREYRMPDGSKINLRQAKFSSEEVDSGLLSDSHQQLRDLDIAANTLQIFVRSDIAPPASPDKMVKKFNGLANGFTVSLKEIPRDMEFPASLATRETLFWKWQQEGKIFEVVNAHVSDYKLESLYGRRGNCDDTEGDAAYDGIKWLDAPDDAEETALVVEHPDIKKFVDKYKPFALVSSSHSFLSLSDFQTMDCEAFYVPHSLLQLVSEKPLKQFAMDNIRHHIKKAQAAFESDDQKQVESSAKQITKFAKHFKGQVPTIAAEQMMEEMKEAILETCESGEMQEKLVSHLEQGIGFDTKELLARYIDRADVAAKDKNYGRTDAILDAIRKHAMDFTGTDASKADLLQKRLKVDIAMLENPDLEQRIHDILRNGVTDSA